MKIHLVNYEDAENYRGGDSVQIQETKKRLENRGHFVTAANSNRPDAHGFDIAHIFNCRSADSLQQQIDHCKQAGAKIIISPIWISAKRSIWGSRGCHAILEKGIQEGENNIASLLEKLKQRKLTVNLNDYSVNSKGVVDSGDKTTNLIGFLLSEADGLLPNSWLELQSIRTDFHWSGNQFKIAHYGVDPRLFLDADPKPFQEKTGIKHPFIMQAGRIEPSKNQAMLCWALRNTTLPVVLIGRSQHWPEYSNLCHRILGDRLTIIDHLPQPLLASAYAAAAVHVLPSWVETCGLVTLEAALSGTPVVGSTFGHELEYLQNDAHYCDPADPDSILRAVQRAWNEGHHSLRCCRLKRRILEKYNWEQTVDSTEELYWQVIEKSC